LGRRQIFRSIERQRREDHAGGVRVYVDLPPCPVLTGGAFFLPAARAFSDRGCFAKFKTQIGGGGALNSTIAPSASASPVKSLNGRTAVADVSGAAGDSEQQQSAQRSDNEFLHLSGLLLRALRPCRGLSSRNAGGTVRRHGAPRCIDRAHRLRAARRLLKAVWRWLMWSRRARRGEPGGCRPDGHAPP
jgi:hypothetical protein